MRLKLIFSFYQHIRAVYNILFVIRAFLKENLFCILWRICLPLYHITTYQMIQRVSNWTGVKSIRFCWFIPFPCVFNGPLLYQWETNQNVPWKIFCLNFVKNVMSLGINQAEQVDLNIASIIIEYAIAIEIF